MKTEKLQLRGNKREHFSYCAAAHQRSLEGTLLQSEQKGLQSVLLLRAFS
jgi:hypothetical protein